MKKSTLITFTSLSALLALSSCEKKQQAQNNGSSSDQNKQSVEVSPETAEKVEKVAIPDMEKNAPEVAETEPTNKVEATKNKLQNLLKTDEAKELLGDNAALLEKAIAEKLPTNVEGLTNAGQDALSGLVETMKGVKDSETAKAALPEIKNVAAKMGAVQNVIKATVGEDKIRSYMAENPEITEKFMDLQKQLTKQMQRIERNDPEAFKEVSDDVLKAVSE